MVAFIFIVVAVILTTLLLLYVTWNKWTSRYSFIHQPDAIPWFGATLAIPFDPRKLFLKFQEYANKYNHLFLLWFGPSPIIFCSRVDYAEAVLSSQTLIKKSSLYRFLHEWLGTGLLTSYGQKWKSRRKVITPSFHFAILNGFSSIFEDQAKTLVYKLRSVADTGKSVDIQVPISLATLDVICETSMGVKVHAQDSSTSEYVNAILSMSSFILLRMRSPWIWPTFIYRLTTNGKEFYKNLKIVHNFTIDVINKSIEKHKKNTESNDGDEILPKKKVFLDMLLDLYDKGEIDVEGIREEVDTFMFEGHDTTASALSWSLYLLGKHPEIQEKLYSEIKSVHTDQCNIVERVKSVKYISHVIKESLRLHPPVPTFGRVTESDTIINNDVIPKGTEIGVFLYDLHRNPMYWDDPDTFNPDRFDDESFSKRNLYCYVPFSAGPRNCIGQKFAMLEEKIFLYHVILNYKLRSTQNEEDIRACIELIHKSENGLILEFESR